MRTTAWRSTLAVQGVDTVHSELRNAMRNFATGVCIASTYRDDPDGRKHDAVTINSLTSVSLEPPLVSMSLRRDSSFLADLLCTKVWAVSILDIGADDIARALAKEKASRATTIDTLSSSIGERTGALVVDSPSWLECELHQVIEAGDHVIVIGEVLVVDVQERRPPLIFLHGRFQTLGGVR
jgi:flavin reductase (DIM6/NTAB) family NADH-FMN oxidoreductase RutF